MGPIPSSSLSCDLPVVERLQLFITALRDPHSVTRWSAAQWSAALALARRERMLGHLAAELSRADILRLVPERGQTLLEEGMAFATHSQSTARYALAQIEKILQPLACPVIALKGCAYILSESEASLGRFAGDIDLLVPRSWLNPVESALTQQGWNTLSRTAYDDFYYRHWMHELPPMAHPDIAATLDLHHSILPLTARYTPNVNALISSAVPIPGSSFKRLCPTDEVLHSITHLFYDGDFTGGLRNLHDIHRLVRGYRAQDSFWPQLLERAKMHQLSAPLYYALHTAHDVLGTPVPAEMMAVMPSPPWALRHTLRRLVDHKLTHTRLGAQPLGVQMASWLLYIRSHWIKMPPLLLAQHLITKAKVRLKRVIPLETQR